MKEKIFIGKWLISIFIGLVAIVIGIVGFVINYMEMGIFFLLVGTAIVFCSLRLFRILLFLITKKY